MYNGDEMSFPPLKVTCKPPSQYPLSDFDLCGFDGKSPQEISDYFESEILNIKSISAFFPQVNHFGDYVIYTDGVTPRFISGVELKEFSVTIPTIEELRAQALAEGVSHSEKYALSKSVSDEFDASVKSAFERVVWYKQVMATIKSVSDVSKDDLLTLLMYTQNAIIEYRWQSFIARTIETSIQFNLLLKVHLNRRSLVVVELRVRRKK